jgi:predicted O-methyltransferase YrrM
VSGVEPRNDEAMAAWIAEAMLPTDRYAEVARQSEEHRAAHGCDLYPSQPGQLLAVIAAAVGASRVLEIGGGIGYSTLWLASGAAAVDTVEADPVHAEMLAANARRFRLERQITVLQGRDGDLEHMLRGPYDMAFYDADIPGPGLIALCERVLRPGGTLLASNVFLGRYVPNHPDLPRGAAVRHALLQSERWQCAFVNGKLLAVLRDH